MAAITVAALPNTAVCIKTAQSDFSHFIPAAKSSNCKKNASGSDSTNFGTNLKNLVIWWLSCEDAAWVFSAFTLAIYVCVSHFLNWMSLSLSIYTILISFSICISACLNSCASLILLVLIQLFLALALALVLILSVSIPAHVLILLLLILVLFWLDLFILLYILFVLTKSLFCDFQL